MLQRLQKAQRDKFVAAFNKAKTDGCAGLRIDEIPGEICGFTGGIIITSIADRPDWKVTFHGEWENEFPAEALDGYTSEQAADKILEYLCFSPTNKDYWDEVLNLVSSKMVDEWSDVFTVMTAGKFTEEVVRD